MKARRRRLSVWVGESGSQYSRIRSRPANTRKGRKEDVAASGESVTCCQRNKRADVVVGDLCGERSGLAGRGLHIIQR